MNREKSDANQSTQQDDRLEQEYQPEQGSPRSPDEKQIRGRSNIGSDRVQQNAGDDVTEAPEEA
jgi:hypothetical protein